MVSANNVINNTVGASISGVTNTFTVTNGSNTAASQATANITVGGGTSGDAWLQTTVSGTRSYAFGIDNSASDALKINTAAGSSVDPSSGTNIWNMSSGGTRLLPQQPTFSAYLSAPAANVTGDGTIYTVVCDTELSDVGNNYNNATGTFTAPVTGNYVFCTNINAINMGGAHTVIVTAIQTTSINFQTQSWDPNSYTAANLSGNVVVPLTAGDTASLVLRVLGGAKTVGVNGGAAGFTYFSGYLLG